MNILSLLKHRWTKIICVCILILLPLKTSCSLCSYSYSQSFTTCHYHPFCCFKERKVRKKIKRALNFLLYTYRQYHRSPSLLIEPNHILHLFHPYNVELKILNSNQFYMTCSYSQMFYWLYNLCTIDYNGHQEVSSLPKYGYR